MINFFNWFWFYRKRYFGGFVFGLFKLFSIWIVKEGFELTISECSYKRVLLWWRKIEVVWIPFGITVYKSQK